MLNLVLNAIVGCFEKCTYVSELDKKINRL